MSRASWINDLVYLGYEPGIVTGLNNNELALLKQEEFVFNKWSAAAERARWAGHVKHELVPAQRIGTGKEARVVLHNGQAAPAHIKPSMISPAWTHVHISLHPEHKILVQGKDAKGRLQTKYNPEFANKQAEAKFARIKEMMGKHEAIGKQIQSHLNSSNHDQREAAHVAWLIHERGIRPGSERDTKAKTQNFGATTLRAEHVKPTKNGVMLEFRGKEGVTNRHELTGKIADMLKERAATSHTRGGKLFDTNDSKLRDYVKGLDGGGFKTKDLRTAIANKIATTEMKNHPTEFSSQKALKQAMNEVATKVSSVLNNRPSQAIKSYIDPHVWSHWKVVPKKKVST